MTRPIVHVVGAGLSGLSAAVHLAAADEADIVVHESAASAGGRRRPLYDEATETSFDSGGDFILSSWPHTLALIEAVGARGHWREAAASGIAFADLAGGQRWTLPLGRSLWPWRLLASRRRAPGVAFADYRPARKLARAPAAARLTDYAPRVGPAAERLWRPLALTALGVDPEHASARLVGAALEAAAWGGARLLAPARGLARGLVEPALKTLARRGASLRFERRLTGLHMDGDHVAALEFAHDRVDLEARDAVILATPPQVASALAPGVSAPQEFSAAIHVHFAVAAPRGAPPIVAVVHGTIHWLLSAEDSITAAIYDAGGQIDRPRDRIAADAWRDVAALTGHSDTLPAWRVVRRPRSAFAATPEQDALRPACDTRWRNLFLAGAYVQTGLPDCLESSARSGAMAAEGVRAWLAARRG
jgi:phytoene dehydrogenase-like protein